MVLLSQIYEALEFATPSTIRDADDVLFITSAQLSNLNPRTELDALLARMSAVLVLEPALKVRPLNAAVPASDRLDAPVVLIDAPVVTSVGPGGVVAGEFWTQ